MLGQGGRRSWYAGILNPSSASCLSCPLLVSSLDPSPFFCMWWQSDINDLFSCEPTCGVMPRAEASAMSASVLVLTPSSVSFKLLEDRLRANPQFREDLAGLLESHFGGFSACSFYEPKEEFRRGMQVEGKSTRCKRPVVVDPCFASNGRLYSSTRSANPSSLPPPPSSLSAPKTCTDDSSLVQQWYRF